MKQLTIILISLMFFAFKQDTTKTETYPDSSLSEAEQLVEKSIAYHDPNGNWETLNAEIKLLQEIPERPDRKTTIYLDNAQSLFKHTSKKGDTTIIRSIQNDSCYFEINGATSFSKEDSTKLKLNCERTRMLYGYHIYLYGMPMKLKDTGTIIDEKIIATDFDGKPCKAIRVTYEESVGKDIWYFYFDNETAALIGYRFYHDETKNDGEFITFKEMSEVNDIKMPKVRTWFYNNDSTLLGADIIEQ